MSRGTRILIGGALALALVALAAAPGGARAARGQRGPARGELTLRVVGLPPAQAAALRLTGPAQAAGGPRLRRSLRPHGSATKLRLEPGRYRLTVGTVTVDRSRGLIRKGATARPARRHLHVKVVGGGSRTVIVRYDSIVNPGLSDVTHSIVRVLGSSTEPSAVILKRGTKVRRGQILSSSVTASLPHGLLARALSVTGGAQPEVVLRGASIYEVAPDFSFDVPVTVTEGASASSAVKCTTTDGEPGADPFVHLSGFHVSGGWSTTHVGFIDVKTGATAELHFDAAAGVKVSVSSGLKCSLDLPALAFQGMAGPIPVYGGIRPGAEVSVGGATTTTAEGTTEITIGVKAGGVPPSAAPILGFTKPKFSVSSSVSAEIKAGLSLSAELGVGAENAANLHVDLTNGVDFSATPGACSWDLDLGAFSATGEVGPLSISTPRTPSLHKNLWHAACGAPPAPPPPPVVAPAPPPSPTLPLTRATMSWGTDADIDLYAWDEAGRLLYFAERQGIPGAELVEDVIPLEGETSHPPEIFRELANPDRHYTFGICDYHREGGPITLEVVDPGGAIRTFHEDLEYEGDGIVVTNSPLGVGYEPEPGWCRYEEDF
jgi:hypothetical protein